MVNLKNEGKKHSFFWLSMIVIVVFAMVLATCGPTVMAGKPVKPPANGEFNLRTLDSQGVVGDCPRIILGSAPDFATHITYYDRTNHALKYATNMGGVWTLKTLATVGNPMGGLADLAMDSGGYLHIIYIDGLKNNQLQYINNIAGAWSAPIPFGAGDNVWGQPCLAIDSMGKFHVSFWESSADGNWITYAYGSPGAIEGTEVFYSSIETLSWYTSIAVDMSDIVHMIYINLDTRVLTYTNNVDWTSKVEMPGVDINANLAIGQGNSVHLSYFSYPDRALNYAVLTGESFTSTVLDASPDSGSHRSGIAIDSNGWVHISYMDYPMGSSKTIIKYATNVGGIWTTKMVDGSSNAGRENDIAVGPGGKVHIVYHGLSTEDLKYATSV